MPYPPRVALVIADSSRTGGPEHVLTLARELAGAGWSPLVVCPPGPLRERCLAAGIPGADLGSAAGSLPGAPARLRRVLRRWDPDVVHSHGLRAGVLVGRAAGPRPLVHTHHLDGWYTTGRIRTSLHAMGLRALGRRARLQIAVSGSVRGFLTAEVGADPAKIRVIPNGVRPLPGAPRPAPAGMRVATLSSLTHTKGVDLALLALAAPAGRRLRLTVAGVGGELSSLIDLAAGLGVADRVDFVGQVQDRARFFADCDLLWVPSRAEPFGLVACEAMSCGVPVIAARVGGLPEILDPPRAGLCVAPANPAALASVSSALLEDPPRYRALSEAGFDRARTEFTAARMGARTRRVYRELLD